MCWAPRLNSNTWCNFTVFKVLTLYFLLRKPYFLFGHSINEDWEVLLDNSYKWLCRLGKRRFFLPDMERWLFLSSTQSMSLHRLMEWNLTEEQSGVSLRRISHHTAVSAGHDRNITGLLPGSLKVEYPEGETLHRATMFINQFMAVKGNFPKASFRCWDGSILRTNISGPGWWASSLKMSYYRPASILRSGLFSVASRKAVIIFLPCWSVTI